MFKNSKLFDLKKLTNYQNLTICKSKKKITIWKTNLLKLKKLYIYIKYKY